MRCATLEGDALDDAWTAQLTKDRSATIVVMEGVLGYFTKEQTATCLRTPCDSFEHGWLVATFGKNVNNRLAVFAW
ncbi:MAG: hypothetical protein IKG18_04000 [Atopobiaceae bacterium]|nr:hypothetical protein [Atopobiaceae bacterium]